MLAKYYTEVYTDDSLRRELGERALLRGGEFSFQKMFEKTVALYNS